MRALALRKEAGGAGLTGVLLQPRQAQFPDSSPDKMDAFIISFIFCLSSYIVSQHKRLQESGLIWETGER